MYETGCGPPVQNINIESTIPHPKFNDYTFQHNIALIRLEKDVIFTDHIRPVCLPTSTVEIPKYVVAGWGAATKDGEFAEILQKAIVPAIGLSDCETQVRKDNSRYYVGEGVICAGTAGTPNTCAWDYGAPLGYPFRYPDKSVRFVQYGITSVTWCGHGPSIYTDVGHYMEWIVENVVP